MYVFRFSEKKHVYMFIRFFGRKAYRVHNDLGFCMFPWSCKNLVIEQLTIPSSKHLSHPVAYFIHEATSVAKANAGKSKFYIEHVVPPS